MLVHPRPLSRPAPCRLPCRLPCQLTWQWARRGLRHLSGVVLWIGIVSHIVCYVGVASAQQVKVESVVDGDTVEIEGGERVRLLGIDAPENKRVWQSKQGKKFQPAQPFFIEAKRFLHRLVNKKRVRLVIGEPSVGYYGRTLAYLYLPDNSSNGSDVQLELIRRGYAMVTVYPPNLQHLQEYARVEAEACRAGRGVWGHPHFALQKLADNKPIRSGRGRIQGVVTSVTYKYVNIRIVLNKRVTLLIHRGVWRKFWQQQRAKDLIGKRIIARGKIKSGNSMRIRHPFMLRNQQCETWQAKN